VSRRIASALLRLAGRRWPVRLRDDLHREWTAELHVLAGEDRPWAMLRYAASLAVARPVREPVTVAERARALWRALRLSILAPLAAVALWIASLVVITVTGMLVPGFLEEMQYWAMALLIGGSAIVLARLGRWWTLDGAGITTLTAAVTVPGFTLSVLQYALSNSSSELSLHGPAYGVFFGGLAGLLFLVDRLAATGRRRRAWWTGVLGALAIADVAVMVPVFLAGDAPHPASAPVWLFTALTGSGFGLPSPAGWEIFTILDVTEFDPQIFVLSAGLALGVIMSEAAGHAGAGRKVTSGRHVHDLPVS